jgi:tetratricopeptide (TPR) repeat protein
MFQASAPDDQLYKITVRANDYFHNKNYQLAAQEYTKALGYIQPNRRLSNATDFTVLLFGNRSACYCMLGQFEDALRDAEFAIRIRPDWGKAWPS